MRLRDTSPLLCLKVALNCFIVTFSLVANCFPCSFSNSSKPGKFRDLKLASITEKKWATMNPLHSMIIGPGLWSLVSRVRQIFQSCSSLGYEIGATRRVEFRSFVALAPREPLPVHSLKTRPVTAIKSEYADGIAISQGLWHPTTANFVSEVALGCQLTPEVFGTKIESLQLSQAKNPRKASDES